MARLKLRILKLKKYSEGLTQAEEDKLLKKKRYRRLTADEFLMYCRDSKFDDYLPCRLQVPNGSVVCGYYSGSYTVDGRFVIGINGRLSGSLGVLGTPIKEEKSIEPNSWERTLLRLEDHERRIRKMERKVIE